MPCDFEWSVEDASHTDFITVYCYNLSIPLFVLLQSGRQRKKAVMMPRVVLTPLKVNGEHVPSGKKNKVICSTSTMKANIQNADGLDRY